MILSSRSFSTTEIPGHPRVGHVAIEPLHETCLALGRDQDILVALGPRQAQKVTDGHFRPKVRQLYRLVHLKATHMVLQLHKLLKDVRRSRIQPIHQTVQILLKVLAHLHVLQEPAPKRRCRHISDPLPQMLVQLAKVVQGATHRPGHRLASFWVAIEWRGHNDLVNDAILPVLLLVNFLPGHLNLI